MGRAPRRKRAGVSGGMERVVAFYAGADEKNRLAVGLGPLEFVRTQEILMRYLPAAPAVILDVGGAAGRYACWLAAAGHEVHLIDPVPSHVDQARRASEEQPEAPVRSLKVGDARSLDFPDGTADAVLMFGPLYHLADASDRAQALSEARRVLKQAGLLFAVGISKFASALEALINGHISSEPFGRIVRRDLESGQHRNPTDNPAYFTDAFFHRPGDLAAEVEAAGFQPLARLMVDPFAYHIQGYEQIWADPRKRSRLLEILRRIEAEPTLMGVGPHLMVVARRPSRSPGATSSPRA
jgi:ubiquinone/menaquinone biosynthesis C-methylase UbiE